MNTTSSNVTSSDGGAFAYTLGPYGFWGFEPSIPLASISIAAFLILGAIILYLSIKHKTWYMIPLVVGCALEIFSFCFRIGANATSTYRSIPIYGCATSPLLLAPTIFAMADYALVSKMYVHIAWI